MRTCDDVRYFVKEEARALLTRVEQLRPLALTMPMVPAANIDRNGIRLVDRYLTDIHRNLRSLILGFIAWVEGAEGRRASPADLQRRFTVLRLRYQLLVTHFDIFADALTQRSEHGYGVWLGGLDVAARDAVQALRPFHDVPVLITYLDRGMGAAIRRARTRLPGGGSSPVTLIRVPRERMVGSGVSSSLTHEIGHQVAALLRAVPSLRIRLQRQAALDPENSLIWGMFERWISEIFADYWAVAKLGIGATMGLVGVVNLPRPFVFRMNPDDPHPFPWIRVMISAAIGDALYPHPQWRALCERWRMTYPPSGLRADKRELLYQLEGRIPQFVKLLLGHALPKLGGSTLHGLVDTQNRTPARLQALIRGADRERLARLKPSLAFAVLGQGRHDGRVSAIEEARTITWLLQTWALREDRQEATPSKNSAMWRSFAPAA